MAKPLFQLTWWKIANIRPFCWLQNESVFCICKRHSDYISDLKGVHFLSYLLLDFFMFLSFWIVLPPMSCFRHFFSCKAITGATEKVFLKPYWLLRWTSDFELFLLYWEVCGYMSQSVVTLGLSVLFLVLANLSCLEV